MSCLTFTKPPGLSIIAGAFGFGLFLWLALPPLVVTIDDDFFYLRSVVETFQRGRPWTYDWGTPWAASMSCLAATLFALTDHFQFAIHFSLALSAALAFLGMCKFQQVHGAEQWRSMLVSMLVLCCPTVLFMLLMFTSVPLYLACLWLCIWLYERRCWWGFLLAWLVGVAARQSAVVWVALPAFLVMTDLLRNKSWLPKRREARHAAWVAGLCVVGFLLLKLGMNHTQGQWVAEQTLKKSLGLLFSSKAVGLGFCALAGGLGMGNLARSFVCSRTHAAPVLGGLYWRLFSVFAIAAGAFAADWCLHQIVWTHSCYNGAGGSVFFLVVGGLSGLGLSLQRSWPRWDFLLAGLGSWLLLLLYRGVFDYYYIDPFFWGFAASLASQQGSAVAVSEAAKPQDLPLWRVWVPKVAGALAVFYFTGWSLFCYVQMKLDQDRLTASNVLYERAFRAGKLQAHEIGFCTFGYAGWLLESYYFDTAGGNPMNLAGFLECTQGWDGVHGTNVLTRHPATFSRYKKWFSEHNSKGIKCDKAVTLVEHQAPFLWFWKAHYTLKRVPFKTDPVLRTKLDYGIYKRPLFPLNNQEWSLLLRRGEGSLSQE